MSQLVIVSRNLKDLTNPRLWLCRQGGEEPQYAQPIQEIIIDEVQFKESTAHEQGFGCSMVAIGQAPDVQKLLRPSEMVTIYFTGSHFRTVPATASAAHDSVKVENAKQIALLPNGVILALL